MKPNKTLTIKAKTEHKCTEKPGTIYEQFYKTSQNYPLIFDCELVNAV